jgi:multidrug efflux pump subunit AcrB
MWEVGANDQIFKAIDYEPLLVAYHNGSAVRISDVGRAQDSVEDLRTAGYANGKPSILVIVFRQPGANIIDTVDRIRAIVPQLEASITIDRSQGGGSNFNHPRFRARHGENSGNLRDPGIWSSSCFSST